MSTYGTQMSTSGKIAATIREAMEHRGVTQVDLATATGMSRVTLQRRLTGYTPFKLDELQAIAAHLDLDLAALVVAA